METDTPRDDGTLRGGLGLWIAFGRKLFAAYPGSLGLKVDGRLAGFGRAADAGCTPDFTLVLHSMEALRRLVMGRDPLRFADAYFRGALDIEGDLFAALGLRDYLHALQLPVRDRLRLLLHTLRLGHGGAAEDGTRPAPGVHAHTPQENRAAIAFHYDVSNDFYALWLDPAMVYSCAYFEARDQSLAEAQTAKLEHICRKLRLRAGERVLDIGCGWGALLIHAARHHGVHAHGVTLSTRQLALAQERVAAAGLSDRVTIELRDYRELPEDGGYDKVASVGMFEHVGLRNLPRYFGKVHALLKPGGLFLNHGITHDEEGWGQALSARFINRYVFPDGELDRLSNVQREMELQGFEIHDVEGLRPHYALTLRHWVANLERAHEAALAHVDESTYRIWRLYMAASALEFEAGSLGVYQILASRRGAEAAVAREQPLTRRHLYR